MRKFFSKTVHTEIDSLTSHARQLHTFISDSNTTSSTKQKPKLKTEHVCNVIIVVGHIVVYLDFSGCFVT